MHQKSNNLSCYKLVKKQLLEYSRAEHFLMKFYIALKYVKTLKTLIDALEIIESVIFRAN